MEVAGPLGTPLGLAQRKRASQNYVLCFSLPLGLPYVNWASLECCLSHLMQ